jgi:uncharacterized membrane protein
MKINLEKASSKIQRPVIVAAAVFAVLTLVFALSFASDLSYLYYHVDPNDVVGYVEGAYVYYDAQDFNRAMLILSVFMILLAVSLFVFFSQKRRIYYRSNYIVTGLYAVYSVVVAVVMLVCIIPLRDDYLYGVDWAQYKQITEMPGFQGVYAYVQSTFWFDFGIVLAIALILLSVCLALNSLVKYKANQRYKIKAAATAEETI